MPIATWNPSDKASGITLSGDLFTASHSTATVEAVRATLSRTTGKWYVEGLVTGHNAHFGLMKTASSLTAKVGAATNDFGEFLDSVSVDEIKFMRSNAVASISVFGSLPAILAIAVDLDLGKIWFRFNGSWLGIGANPATGAGAFYSAGVVGPLFPAWSSSPIEAASSCNLRLTSFTYAAPAGFLPWDDFVPNIGAAAGSSVATGAGAWIVPATGAAAGISVATGTAPPQSAGSGYAAGSSTVTGAGMPPSSGQATGVSVATGAGAYVAPGVGYAAGKAWVHGHQVYTINRTVLLTGISAAATRELDDSALAAPTMLVDGLAYWYAPPAVSDATYLDNTTITLTWPTPHWISGITLYSDGYHITPNTLAWLDAAAIESFIQVPTGTPTTTEPPARQLHDGQQRSWFVHTGNPTAVDRADPTKFVQSYTNPYRVTTGISVDNWYHSVVQEIQFDVLQYTNKINISGVLGEIYEVLALGTGGPITYATYVETARATATLIGAHVVAASATANATSTLIGRRVGKHVSTANVTSTAALSSMEVLNAVFVSTANATSTAIPSLLSTSVSTANITATALASRRQLELVSTANVTGLTTGSWRTGINIIVSTANATSAYIGHDLALFVSTANVTATATALREAIATLVSTAAIVANAPVYKSAVQTLVSRGVASATALLHQTANQILISTANATATFLSPLDSYTGLWANSFTMAPGTWGGMPFNSMIEVGGVVYGAGVAGVYKVVEGANDGTNAINAEVLYDLEDFNDQQKKRYGAAYIAGTSAKALNVQVINEQGRYNYKTHLPATTKPTNLRALFGRGLQSRYIRLSITNPGGVDFTYNDIKVEVVSLSRRIGGKHA